MTHSIAGSQAAATPFLTLAADFYKDRPDLIDHCFVFPNRRSGQFFVNNLKNLSSGTVILPEVTTIADFLSSITKENPISSVEALFTLFSCYKEIDPSVEFDKFVYWGNMLLNDFNEIDMYMVDAQALFTNVKDNREIATDYIDDELKAKLSEFFKLSIYQSAQSHDRLFKSDGSADDDNVKTRFVKMWNQLYNLYSSFTGRLSERNLSYTGIMYRHAVACVNDMHPDQFRHKHYVFVGFNILSTAQIAIFKSLKNKGLAEFLWDFNSPAFSEKENKGAKFISFYKKMFPQPALFQEPEIKAFPPITVTGVPSNVGQVKYALHVVDQLIVGKSETEKERILNNTAIVLPDESLFIPLVNTIGPDITDTNITLGYPLSSSSIVSLMRTVSVAHKHAYHDKTADSWTFLRNDILNVLSHPIIKAKFPKLSITLTNELKKGNLYKVKQSTILDTELHLLFETVTPDTGSITAHISRLIEFAQSLKASTNVAADSRLESSDNESPSLQDAFIDAYVDVLNELKQSLATHNLSTQSLTTLFYLIDKLAGKHTVPFEGEPLKGLQIMGVLETRCLDFQNVIVLSMNDSVFPRKHFSSPSFISENLRRGFLMSNSDDQEAMPTYYFYRLISRAAHVELIYNSSATNAASAEWSRFITQLQKVYGCHLTLQEASSKIKPADDINISIAHGQLMAHYFDASVPAGEFAKNSLSASSINEYINCPLKFYFHHIQHLSDDNPESDFMDASTKGTIVHNTLQALYSPTGDTHKIVTLLDILNFSHSQLRRVIEENINTEFVHSRDKRAPLTGEAQIIIEPLMQYVRNALEFDVKLLLDSSAFDIDAKKLLADKQISVFSAMPNDGDVLNLCRKAYFEVYECEQTHNVRLRVTKTDADSASADADSNDVTFNFNYKPDRIDRVNGTGPVRLIDYKTGSDPTQFSNAASLFDNTKSTVRPHAILQQFLYANAYLQEHPEVSEIRPLLYTMGSQQDFGIYQNKEGQVTVTRGNELNFAFCSELHTLLSAMRDPDSQFCQVAASSSPYLPCKYCNFVDFCRR